MNDQPITNNEITTNGTNAKKPIHSGAFALSIISLIFALLLPLVTYICAPISLAQSGRYKNEFRVKPCVVMDIIALIAAVINSVLGIIFYTK